MENIEELAQNYYLKEKGYRVKNSVAEGFSDGYNFCEEKYSKLLSKVESENYELKEFIKAQKKQYDATLALIEKNLDVIEESVNVIENSEKKENNEL